MLKFLIDNIFVMFGIHMGTNCARLLTDLLLYSYEEDFIRVFLERNEKKLALSFSFTYRYIYMMSFNYEILSLVILLITSIPLILK
jgi:hypothetical protein